MKVWERNAVSCLFKITGDQYPLVAHFHLDVEALAFLNVERVEAGRHHQRQRLLAILAGDVYRIKAAIAGRPRELAVDRGVELVGVPAQAVGVFQIGGNIERSEGAVGIAQRAKDQRPAHNGGDQ